MQNATNTHTFVVKMSMVFVSTTVFGVMDVGIVQTAVTNDHFVEMVIIIKTYNAMYNAYSQKGGSFDLWFELGCHFDLTEK